MSAEAEVMGQRAPSMPTVPLRRDKSALLNVFLCGPLVRAGGRNEKMERGKKKEGGWKTCAVPTGGRMHNLKVNSGTVKVQLSSLSNSGSFKLALKP